MMITITFIIFTATFSQSGVLGGNLDLEKEVLPHLDCMQRVYLFGSAIQLKQADPSEVTNSSSAGYSDSMGMQPPPMAGMDDHMSGTSDMGGGAPYGGRRARSMNSFLETTALVIPSSNANESVTLRMSDIFNLAASGTDVEGRGRLKKILIPLMLALTITAAIVIPALMTVIKLIAVKGLWSGIVSLIISKLVGLKALLNHHHHSHTVSDDGKRPYLIYLPNGKRRREEEEGAFQGFQGQDAPWNQWNQGQWNNWRRESTNDNKQQ